jgi:hypothetical protein
MHLVIVFQVVGVEWAWSLMALGRFRGYGTISGHAKRDGLRDFSRLFETFRELPDKTRNDRRRDGQTMILPSPPATFAGPASMFGRPLARVGWPVAGAPEFKSECRSEGQVVCG